jgi:hypothetical protein
MGNHTAQYVHFRARNFYCPVSRLGPIRHLEFLRNQQLTQKVYKCVNMFLEIGSILRKKGSRRPTKTSAENIEEGEQRIIAEINVTQATNLSFGTVQLILKKYLHFCLYRVSVVHEITP